MEDPLTTAILDEALGAPCFSVSFVSSLALLYTSRVRVKGRASGKILLAVSLIHSIIIQIYTNTPFSLGFLTNFTQILTFHFKILKRISDERFPQQKPKRERSLKRQARRGTTRERR